MVEYHAWSVDYPTFYTKAIIEGYSKYVIHDSMKSQPHITVEVNLQYFHSFTMVFNGGVSINGGRHIHTGKATHVEY